MGGRTPARVEEELAALRERIDALATGVETLTREVGEVRRHLEHEARRRRHEGEPERVGLFVDVQNMYYAARQLNARLDFGALMNATTRGRRLIRAMAYVVQNRDIDQSGFLAMLQQKNYEVRRKDLKIRSDGSSKGDWDMEMALDILKMAGSLDVVVLVTGDGDFASLVTQIRTLGPQVEVYSFPGSTAKELVEAADRHVALDESFLIKMSPSG
ncbi:MAG: NYN domain-containing protein [Candidatus Polarisedimenticolia bacterium]